MLWKSLLSLYHNFNHKQTTPTGGKRKIMTTVFSKGRIALNFQNGQFEIDSPVFWTVEMSNVYDIARFEMKDTVNGWYDIIDENGGFDLETIKNELETLQSLPEDEMIYSGVYEGLEQEERDDVWLRSICFALNNL